MKWLLGLVICGIVQAQLATSPQPTPTPSIPPPPIIIGSPPPFVPLNCSQQLLFNLTTSGNTQIIPAPVVSGNIIQICHLSFSTTATEDIKLTVGFGTNCSGGPGAADLTGLYKTVQSLVFNNGPLATIRTPLNVAVCLNQSATQNLGGLVIYAITPPS